MPIATRTRVLTDHCGMKRAMRFTALFSEISIVPDGQPVRTNNNLPPAREEPARARVVVGNADVDEAGARAVAGEGAGGREFGEEVGLERECLRRLREPPQGRGAEDVEAAIDPAGARGTLLPELGDARPREAHGAEARAVRDARDRQGRRRSLDPVEADELLERNREEGVAVECQRGRANGVTLCGAPQRAAGAERALFMRVGEREASEARAERGLDRLRVVADTDDGAADLAKALEMREQEGEEGTP